LRVLRVLRVLRLFQKPPGQNPIPKCDSDSVDNQVDALFRLKQIATMIAGERSVNAAN